MDRPPLTKLGCAPPGLDGSPAQSVDTEVLVEKNSDNGFVVPSQAVDLEVFEPLEGVDPGGVVFGTHGHDPGARGPLHARRVIKRTLQIKKQFIE